MKLEVGQKIKLRDKMFRVKYIMDDYVLLLDISASINEGGGLPLMAKISEDKIKLVMDKNEIKPIMTEMLTKMLNIEIEDKKAD